MAKIGSFALFFLVCMIVAKLWDDNDPEFWIVAILNGLYLAKTLNKIK